VAVAIGCLSNFVAQVAWRQYSMSGMIGIGRGDGCFDDITIRYFDEIALRFFIRSRKKMPEALSFASLISPNSRFSICCTDAREFESPSLTK
jgi:hypothetical protein